MTAYTQEFSHHFIELVHLSIWHYISAILFNSYNVFLSHFTDTEPETDSDLHKMLFLVNNRAGA